MRCVNQRQLLPFRETALPIKKTLVRTSVHPRRMDISAVANFFKGDAGYILAVPDGRTVLLHGV
jgi:hypothetical protein